MTQVGEKEIQFEGYEHISQNPFFAANQSQIAELENYMDSVRKSLDSVGAKLHIEASNVPVGLGEPVFDRLDAEIAYAMMGINAVTHGRHDPCVGLRAAPIAEAMLALVLIDHALRHRAQNADVVVDTPDIAKQRG